MNEQPEEAPACRICLETKEVGPDGPLGRLFRPCLCNGTQRFIHEECLMKLRQSGRQQNFHECPTCHYRYRFTRVDLAQLLAHPLFVTILTLIIIVVSVVTVAWFLRFFALMFFGIHLTHRAFALTGRLIWWSVLVIGCLTLIVAFLTALASEDNAGWDFDFGDAHGVGGPIGNGFFNNIPQLPALFSLLGYGFSLTGFAMFVYGVYDKVRQILQKLLVKIGDRIVEVR